MKSEKVIELKQKNWIILSLEKDSSLQWKGTFPLQKGYSDNPEEHF